MFRKNVNSPFCCMGSANVRWSFDLDVFIKVSAGRCSGISICVFALCDDTGLAAAVPGVSLIPQSVGRRPLALYRGHVHLGRDCSALVMP